VKESRRPSGVAPDGSALLVTTQLGTGKIKRLRHTSRVEVRPCDRLGRVASGVAPIAGVGEIREDVQSVREPNDAMATKYGLTFRLILLAERAFRRHAAGRIVVRVTQPTAPQ